MVPLIPLLTALCFKPVEVILSEQKVLRGFLIGEGNDSLLLELPSGKLRVKKERVLLLKPIVSSKRLLELVERYRREEQAGLLGRVVKAGELSRGVVAECFLSLAKEELKNGRFDLAKAHSSRALALDPASKKASDLYEEASGLVERARRILESFELILKENPADDYVRYKQALCYESLGRTAEALEALRSIIRSHPSLQPKRLTLEYLKEFITSQFIVERDSETTLKLSSKPTVESSEHFVVSSYDSGTSRRVASFAEKFLKSSEKRFALKLKQFPVHIRILRSRKEYLSESPLPGTYATTLDPTTVLTYHGSWSPFISIIGHEILHILLRQNFDRVEPWLDEGFACYFEPAGGIYYERATKLAKEGRLLPLDKLRQVNSLKELSSPKDRDRFYVSAFMAVDGIVQKEGVEGLLSILRESNGAKKHSEQLPKLRTGQETKR